MGFKRRAMRNKNVVDTRRGRCWMQNDGKKRDLA